MRYTLKSFIICLTVVAMTLQPAGACHWFRGQWGGGGHWGGGHRGAHHWGGYASWGPGYYCGPVGYGGYCGGAPVVYSGYYGGGGCGPCDGGSWSGGSYDGAVIDGEVVVEPQYEPVPIAPADDRPRARTQTLPPPPPQRPATVDRPVDRDVAPTLPPPPPEDTFVPRSEPSPPAPMPTQPLPPAEPADDDDFFGTPAEPADEPDDLFNGTEAAVPPATPPEPATLPATEAEDTDDFFDLPAEAPAETPSEPAEPAPPADEPADDAFNFFGTETEMETPAATEDTPAEETPADETPAEEEDDLFNFDSTRSVLGEPGGLASAELRVWIDNTGSYSCRGRLVRFLDAQVQLLKDNGRTTTVPLYRLSASDLEFVHRQASAQQAEALQTAQR